MKSDNEYYNYENKTITLESCPGGGRHCHGLLAKLNALLSTAQNYTVNKEFEKALFTKEEAFNETFILDKEQCLACGVFFRNLILVSVTENVKELKMFTTGLIRRRKYILVLELARSILKDMNERMESFNNAQIKQVKKADG